MQTLKRKEEESKISTMYFTSQLQEMDEQCKSKKLKINALEEKLKQGATKNQKLSKEIMLLRNKFEYTEQEKRIYETKSTKEIISLKDQLQQLQRLQRQR